MDGFLILDNFSSSSLVIFLITNDVIIALRFGSIIYNINNSPFLLFYSPFYYSVNLISYKTIHVSISLQLIFYKKRPWKFHGQLISFIKNEHKNTMSFDNSWWYKQNNYNSTYKITKLLHWQSYL